MALENKLGITDSAEPAKEDYLLAMERSPIKDVEIKILIKNALTDEKRVGGDSLFI